MTWPPSASVIRSLLERYIESVYSGKKLEAWCTMLMQAYDMRALVVLLDGVDEAAGLRDQIEEFGSPSDLPACTCSTQRPWLPTGDQIEEFVHKEVVPSGNRVLVTSRPEGVRLESPDDA